MGDQVHMMMRSLLRSKRRAANGGKAPMQVHGKFLFAMICNKKFSEGLQF
jgi:hypothetical protein